MCAEAHDEATKFIFTLNAATRPFNSHCLRKEDFLPILMDLILVILIKIFEIFSFSDPSRPSFFERSPSILQ